MAALNILIGMNELKEKINQKLFTTSNFLSESKTNSQRTSNLKKEEKNLKIELNYLSNQSKKLISNVLFVRFQDIMHEIRILCIETMEQLIKSEFKDEITETIKKISYDRKSEVRLKVLKTLKNLAPNLLDFQKRILEMCFDIDDKCCAAAIDLCQYFSELSEADSDKITALA